MKWALSLVQDRNAQTTICIFSVTFAPFRYCSAWALQHTHLNNCEVPALLNLVSERHSPITKSLQYLHSVTKTDVMYRFSLIVAMSGCSTQQEFVARHTCSFTYGSAAKTAGAWLYWRNLKYKRGPFSAAGLTDKRTSRDVKLGTCRDLFRPSSCCNDNATEKLVVRCRHAEDLLQPRNLRVCSGISRIPIHSGTIETFHGRNQTHNSINVSWATFSARFVNAQARYHQSRTDSAFKHADRQLRLPPRALPHSSGEECDVAAETPMLPGTSGKQVLHFQSLQQDKLAGRATLAADEFYWSKIDRAWKLLQEHSPAEARSLSLIAKHNASQPRGKNKHRQTHGALDINVANTAVDTCVPCDRGAYWMLPRLKATSICQACSRPGAEHPRHVQHMDILLRKQSEEYSSLTVSEAGSNISGLSMSVELYSAERAEWPGGLKCVEEQWDRCCRGIGKDVGAVPDDQPVLRRCKYGFCRKDLSVSGRSAQSQVSDALTRVVTVVGGPKKVPTVQPPEPQRCHSSRFMFNPSAHFTRPYVS